MGHSPKECTTSNPIPRIFFNDILTPIHIILISNREDIDCMLRQSNFEQEFYKTYSSSYSRSNSFKVIYRRGWFKFDRQHFLKEIAYFVGKVMGDGNLDRLFVCRFIGDRDTLFCLVDILSSRFKIPRFKMSIRRKFALGESYLLQINDCLFGRLLYTFGAPIGNKTRVPFLVPDWIFSSVEFKKLFLQALLEDELAKIRVLRSNHANTPNFKMHKGVGLENNLVEFLTQVKILIESFDVDCSHIVGPKKVYNKSTKVRSLQSYFWIQRNKQNIINFKEKLGFRFNLDKIEALDHCYGVLKSSL